MRFYPTPDANRVLGAIAPSVSLSDNFMCRVYRQAHFPILKSIPEKTLISQIYRNRRGGDVRG
ncbi:MAG: hypothetical protein RIB93_01105 [Coleofasciculus sp. D1-CHI-01]|uniref:hypothetical protein n=1 Tax=Coleofasciculus sp. D1-CHI-01 TaxID=3068482 RepID=UPI0032F361DA